MKLLKQLSIGSILILYSVFGFAGTQESSIEDLNSKWISQLNSGDMLPITTLYTDNAVMFPPSSEILDSPVKIAIYLDQLKQQGIVDYNISRVSLDVRDNIAYTTSLWEATRVDQNGNSIVFEGNITSVLEKQPDGNWKIRLQSWN